MKDFNLKLKKYPHRLGSGEFDSKLSTNLETFENYVIMHNWLVTRLKR